MKKAKREWDLWKINVHYVEYWACDTSESFFLKATFKRKLSDVAYAHPQVFIYEVQLSETERVLFMKVFFAYAELRFASQQRVTLLTRVSWWLYCAWYLKMLFQFQVTTNIIVVIVKWSLHSQYSSIHEATPVLTCHFLFQISSVSCGTCSSFLAKRKWLSRDTFRFVIGFIEHNTVQ